MTFDSWWDEHVAMAWYSRQSAKLALAELEQTEPETVRLFTKLGFRKYLLQDIRSVEEAFKCLRRYKRQPEFKCPGIAETKAAKLIERLEMTLRRVWFWIQVMRLDESVRWTRHGLMFRAELVRNKHMAYRPGDWPEPFLKVHKVQGAQRRPASRAPAMVGPLTPEPPINVLKRKR